MDLFEGSWYQNPAWVIGGGPSLKGLDWNWLKDKPHCIAINRSFVELPTAELFFTEDARFLLRFPKEFAKEWAAFRGQKLWHCLEEHEIPAVMEVAPDIQIIRRTREDKFWSRHFKQGLSYSSCSAVGALNIAWLMGADPIYCLGLDCRTEGLFCQNYHDSYRADPMWEVGANAADNFKNDLEGWVAPNMRDTEVINVVNPAYESALTCWPKKTYQEVFCS